MKIYWKKGERYMKNQASEGKIIKNNMNIITKIYQKIWKYKKKGEKIYEKSGFPQSKSLNIIWI